MIQKHSIIKKTIAKMDYTKAFDEKNMTKIDHTKAFAKKQIDN